MIDQNLRGVGWWFLSGNWLAFFKGRDVDILSSLYQSENEFLCSAHSDFVFTCSANVCCIFYTFTQGPRISHTDFHRLRWISKVLSQRGRKTKGRGPPISLLPLIGSSSWIALPLWWIDPLLGCYQKFKWVCYRPWTSVSKMGISFFIYFPFI